MDKFSNREDQFDKHMQFVFKNKEKISDIDKLKKLRQKLNPVPDFEGAKEYDHLFLPDGTGGGLASGISGISSGFKMAACILALLGTGVLFAWAFGLIGWDNEFSKSDLVKFAEEYNIHYSPSFDVSEKSHYNLFEGINYYNNEKYDKAYDELIKVPNQDSEIQLIIGRSLSGDNKHQTAKERYENILDNSEEELLHDFAEYYLAMEFLYLGDAKNALHYLRMVDETNLTKNNYFFRAQKLIHELERGKIPNG